MSETNSQAENQWGGWTQRPTASKPMQEILPRLYLGDLRAAENMEDLHSNNISFVLTIKYQNLSLATRRAYLKARISQIHIQKRDCLHEELLTTFEPACDMIEGKLTKGQAVLVHCALGRSRSATVMIAYVMRHMNMNYHEADAFVRTKRDIINPNFQFCEQLKLWEKSGFDFQNLRIEDAACAMYLSCTPSCRQVFAGVQQQAKQQAEGGNKEIEEKKDHKEDKDEKEAKEVKKDGEDGENEKGSAEGRDKEQAQIPEEEGGTKEATTEASPIAPDSIEESTSPQSIEAELGSGLGMHVKSQGPPNIDNHSAADGPCDDIDTASTKSAPIEPAPKVVRAAIESLYLKYPAMGKKKLLRILNASQGWSIGNKEFRSHLETIVAG